MEMMHKIAAVKTALWQAILFVENVIRGIFNRYAKS
jgi:hypothetical protein